MIPITLLLLSGSAYAGEVSQVDQRALEALNEDQSDVVRQLPKTEKMLLKATIALKDGSPQQALEFLKGGNSGDPLLSLIEAEAHRRSAVMAVASAGNYARGLEASREKLEGADFTPGLAEAEVRLNAFIDRLDGVYGEPMHLLQLGPEIQSVFMVDKARSRMFVYERNETGKFERVADEYVVTGAKGGDKQKSGDARTPNGIYRFVKRLNGNQLEAKYGPVAFPIDYPNELDRLHHKNGHGIWMHGYAEGVDRRPPQDTRGCFALPNDRLLAMADHVHLKKSWVVVGEDFVFNQDNRKQALLKSVKASLAAWQQDWTSLDTEAYLAHYHEQFHSGNRDLEGWKKYKRRVNSNKSFIEVKLSDVSLIEDPSHWPEGDVVVAEFNQDYRSNNYQDHSRKRLYLARSDANAEWKILIEETVSE